MCEGTFLIPEVAVCPKCFEAIRWGGPLELGSGTRLRGPQGFVAAAICREDPGEFPKGFRGSFKSNRARACVINIMYVMPELCLKLGDPGLVRLIWVPSG